MRLDPRLLGLAAPGRPALVATVVLGAVAGTLAVVQARLLAHVVDRAFLGGAGQGELALPLSVLLGTILVRATLAGAGEVTGQRAASRAKLALRSRLLDHLVARGALAQDLPGGEVTATLVDGVEELDPFVRDYLPQVALAAVVPLQVVVAVAVSDPLSAAILALTAPLIPVFMVLVADRAEARSRRQWREMGRLQAFILDVIQGLVTLRLLGRSRDALAKMAEASARFRAATLGVLRVAFVSALALELVATVSTAVVAVEVGLRLLYGRLDFEAAFFVLLLAPELYLPLRLLGSRYHAGLAGASAAERALSLLGRRPGVPPAGAQPVPERLDLELEDVHVAYPDRPESPVLAGLSLRVAPGEKVALVGPSGAGKTTVVRLLLGFLQPDQGRVTVDGVPLDRLDPEAWRGVVGWVPQEPNLLHGTVEANLRLGRPDASPAELEAAMSAARFDPVAARLPDGLCTPIGEGGARLSGGEAQRLALARALLVAPRLLLLDEGTSALDPQLQAELAQGLRALPPACSAVIVAHRLPTALAADRIAVLDQGRVVASGTHHDLLASCPLYRRLVAAYEGEP